MRVFLRDEFLACVRDVVRTQRERDLVEQLLRELAEGWQEAEFRVTRLNFGNRFVFVTKAIRLRGREYRVAWNFGEHEGERVIECWTLAHTDVS